MHCPRHGALGEKVGEDKLSSSHARLLLAKVEGGWWRRRGQRCDGEKPSGWLERMG